MIHWQQEENIHINSTNVGYQYLHKDPNVLNFTGFSLSSSSSSTYLDGMTTSGEWWYAIGQTKYFNESFIAGPCYPGAIPLYDVSLFIRFTDISQLQRLPIILSISLHRIFRIHLSYSYFLIFVLLK